MKEVEVYGVIDQASHPVVLLRHEDRILPIVVGIPEAQAIQFGVMGEKLGRPMTHDLLGNVLAGLRASVQSVTIYKLENDTFYAHLKVEQRNAQDEVEQMMKVDSRPSDGIAIAVRQQCPIYVAEEVLDAAAQDIPDSATGDG